MYNDGDANLLQYIFELDPTKTTKTYYPDVGSLKAEDIYKAQS